MGTDLRIVQRVTKIVKDEGGTLVITGSDLELIEALRHKGALGEADLKRIRSVKRKPEYVGLQQIHNALLWGETVGKLGIIKIDGHRMLYTIPLEPVVDSSEELPAANVLTPSHFKPLSSFSDATYDPAVLKHLRNSQLHWLEQD